MRCGGSPAMSSPSKMILPAVGRSTPVTQLKNVDLPAPFGPIMARISPGWTAMETLLSAVSPPKRTVRPSVYKIGAAPRLSAGMAMLRGTVMLVELTGRREDRRLLWDDLHDPVPGVTDFEDELANKGLVVVLAERLVSLREVVALLDLQTLERLDELHRILAPAEARLLHAELQEVHRLVVRLHVPVGQRAAWIDLLEPRHGLVEELLVRSGVQRRVEHRHVAIDPDKALDLVAKGWQVRGLGNGAVARPLILLREAEVVRLVTNGHAILAEEDPE